MDTSIFLAKLIGPILAVIGLGPLINRATYQAVAEEVVKSRVQLYLSGVLALTAGLAIVLSHNEWDLSWQVIITIIGWLAILRGLLRLLIPQQIGDFLTRALARGPQVLTGVGVVALIIGAFLAWKGYSGT
jgi:uncharacterized protein YjeT (DUF2065 family)